MKSCREVCSAVKHFQNAQVAAQLGICVKNAVKHSRQGSAHIAGYHNLENMTKSVNMRNSTTLFVRLPSGFWQVLAKKYKVAQVDFLQ